MNYRFRDTQARVYVERALLAEPGDVVDWPDGAPDDGQWEPVGDDTPTTAELAEQAHLPAEQVGNDEDGDQGLDAADHTEDSAPSAPNTEE